MTTVDQLIYTRAITLAQGTNLNDVRDAGFYQGLGLGNAPHGGFWYVEVQRAADDASYVTQRLTELAPGNGASTVYIRTCIGGNWGPLVQLYTSANPPPASGGGGGGGSDGVPFSAFGGVADYNPATRQGTDNTAALNAAINSGQKVYFPAGNYYFGGRVTSINKSVNFQGAGFGLTAFYFGYGGTDGAVITCATDNNEQAYHFHDIDFRAHNPNTQVYRAVDIVFPEGLGSRPDCPTVHCNLRIIPGVRGAGGPGDNWKNGYKLVNAWKPIIEGSFWGASGLIGANGQLGFSDDSAMVETDGGQFASLILTIRDFEGYYAQYGVKISSYMESLTLRSAEFVGCNKGVWNNPNFAGGGGSAVQVKGGTIWMVEGTHMATIERCLDLNNIYYVFGAPNFQNWAGTAYGGWEGIRATNCQGAKLYGGLLQGPGTGLVFTNGTNGYHVDMVGANLTTGLVATQDSQNCFVKLQAFFPQAVAGNNNWTDNGSGRIGFASVQGDGSIIGNKPR